MIMSGCSFIASERVGAAVDGDQHGLVLADVRAERLEVVLVVVTAHHHEGVAPAYSRAQRRELERLERDLRFGVDVRERVARERLELHADGPARFLHARFDLVGREQLPHCQLLVVAPERAVAQLQHFTFSDLVHDLGPDGVEQRDPGRHDPDRTTVGIAPRDRRSGVHDRGDPRRHQRVGRDPVDVAVIDDCDVARVDAPDEILRAPVGARGSFDLDRPG